MTEQEYLENDESDFWSDLRTGRENNWGVSEEELDSEMEKIALADKYQSVMLRCTKKEYRHINLMGKPMRHFCRNTNTV